MDKQELRGLLENLHSKYNNSGFIEADPISLPHKFTRKEDIEIAGFLAATIAWGNRKVIVRNAHRMAEMMDNSPYDFTMNASREDMAPLMEFVHRTFNGDDFLTFIMALRNIYTNHGGIGAFFERSYAQSSDMRKAISEFRNEFFSIEHDKRSQKHLSSIDKGAACKRLNMFIRWMVRKDDHGVDFGLWEGIPSSAIYLPLDVHSGNMSRELGLLSRTQNDWRAVEEVTQSLAGFDPEDPVKYDFALFGAGIDGYLK